MKNCCKKWLEKNLMYEEITQSNVERVIKYVVIEPKYCPECGEILDMPK